MSADLRPAPRLVDLDPRWCLAHRYDTPDGTQHFIYPQSSGSVPRHGMGLSFLCPVHRNHRLAVMFANPIDGLPGCAESAYRWQRTGETFEDLTLGPSIDASGVQHGTSEIQTPCWHGHITNGDIR